MNQEPLAISRFVALVSKDAIDQETVRAWYGCVKAEAPSGTLLAIPTTDDKGMPRTVCLVHRETGRNHLYLVPLTRDLEETEASRIVKAFSSVAPDGDFEIETSASHLAAQDAPETDVVFDEEKYLELCMAWAKRQHENWMQDRTDRGWRYGTELSMSTKTNPLLRPFDQLPDEYRKPNLQEPQALLDLLNDQGYAVITKQELAAMLTLMRQAATVMVPARVAESRDGKAIGEGPDFAARLRRASLEPTERRDYDNWNGTTKSGHSHQRAEEPDRPAPAKAASKPSGRALPPGSRAVFGKRRGEIDEASPPSLEDRMRRVTMDRAERKDFDDWNGPDRSARAVDRSVAARVVPEPSMVRRIPALAGARPAFGKRGA